MARQSKKVAADRPGRRKAAPTPSTRGPRGPRQVPYGGARDNIRHAARQLFYTQGLQTGLDEVLRTAGASKPTFYHHFEGRAALEQDYFASQAAELWSGFERIAEKSVTLRQFITRWMHFVRRRMGQWDSTGCPLGNFAVQAPPAHQADVQRVFGLSVEKFEQVLVAKGLAPRRAAELAPNIFLVYQGSLLMVRATQDRSYFTRATKLMIEMAEGA